MGNNIFVSYPSLDSAIDAYRVFVGELITTINSFEKEASDIGSGGQAWSGSAAAIAQTFIRVIKEGIVELKKVTNEDDEKFIESYNNYMATEEEIKNANDAARRGNYGSTMPSPVNSVGQTASIYNAGSVTSTPSPQSSNNTKDYGYAEAQGSATGRIVKKWAEKPDNSTSEDYISNQDKIEQNKLSSEEPAAEALEKLKKAYSEGRENGTIPEIPEFEKVLQGLNNEAPGGQSNE